MFKKSMLYVCIILAGLQPYVQAAGYFDAVPQMAETVMSEGEKIVVPLASALVNIGDACVNGVKAGGRIVWVTTKLGVKCADILSEGCMHLVRFSGNHPEFVTGVAIGVGVAYLISGYNKQQADYYRRRMAREIGDSARLIRGQSPVTNN